MKKLDIQVVRADLLHITNKDTGVVTEMTKITYLSSMESTETSTGYAILECYRTGSHMSKLIPFIGKKCSATITEQPLKNGVKYVISKLDNVEL